MLEWMDDALCRQIDAELFFPLPNETPHDALKACKLCPVQAECFAFGMEGNYEGVWGGTTHSQRKLMRKRIA
jgi:WhiB family redox-sensing transcriptional regulator